MEIFVSDKFQIILCSQCGHPNKFDVARQRFMSRKISQFKALSSMILEAEQYDRLDNHRAFCCEASTSEGGVDVAESLERMRIKVDQFKCIFHPGVPDDRECDLLAKRLMTALRFATNLLDIVVNSLSKAPNLWVLWQGELIVLL